MTGVETYRYDKRHLLGLSRSVELFDIKSIVGIIVLLASATAGETRRGELGMRCPHCTVTVHPAWECGWIDDLRGDRPCWQWTKTVCPACHETIIKVRLRSIWGGEAPGEEAEPVHKEMWIEPSSPKRVPLGEGVPSEFIAAYEEACAVLPVSAKASAALSRRVLQSILRHQGYDARNLADQIDKLLAETRADKALPSSVKESVDVIRQFGNFSAHRITDKSTLQVIPVAPEEASWCLEIVEALFDHYYVIPAANKKRLDELNERLQRAGERSVKS